MTLSNLAPGYVSLLFRAKTTQPARYQHALLLIMQLVLQLEQLREVMQKQ